MPDWNKDYRTPNTEDRKILQIKRDEIEREKVERRKKPAAIRQSHVMRRSSIAGEIEKARRSAVCLAGSLEPYLFVSTTQLRNMRS
mmetsp:Transcript_24199/g.58462  ORF Transcript_24199/g.58462 Transcript_24199/m.58462 type:complete len:86 (+) Transcript_24199:260-517(+)